MASTAEGYDYNFIEDIPEDLTCSVCYFAVREPVQLGSCGHELCKLCFEKLKDHAETR